MPVIELPSEAFRTGSEFHGYIRKLYDKCQFDRSNYLIPIHVMQAIVDKAPPQCLLLPDKHYMNKSILHLLVYIEREPAQLFATLMHSIFNDKRIFQVVAALMTPSTQYASRFTLLCYILFKGRGAYLDYVLQWMSSIQRSDTIIHINTVLKSTVNYIQENPTQILMESQNRLCERIIYHFGHMPSLYSDVLALARLLLQSNKRLIEINQSIRPVIHHPRSEKTQERLFQPEWLLPINEDDVKFFDLDYQKLTLDEYLLRKKEWVTPVHNPRDKQKLSAAGKIQEGMWGEALVFKNTVYRMLEKYGQHYFVSQESPVSFRLNSDDDLVLDLIHPQKGYFQMRFDWPNQSLYRNAYFSVNTDPTVEVSAASFDIAVYKKFPNQNVRIKNIEVKSSRYLVENGQRAYVTFSKNEIRKLTVNGEKYRLFFVSGAEAEKNKIRIFEIKQVETAIPLVDVNPLASLRITL